MPRAAVGVFLLLVIALAGCAAAREGGRASPAGCTAIATRAARGQARLRAEPRPCRGLGSFELTRAVKIAVGDAAGNGTKALRRHLTIQAYRRLTVLTAAADREAVAQRAARARRLAAHPPARPSAAGPRLRIPADVSALVAWLLAAGSGGLLVLRRLARRPRRRLPPVLVAHLGFAVAGLAVWVAYLVTGSVVMAWAALGVLLPVAGLGMATLLLAIPDPKPETGSSGSDRLPRSAPSGATAGRALAAGAATATRLAPAPAPATTGAARRPRPPVLLIAAHGALATITILLALLGTVSAVLAH